MIKLFKYFYVWPFCALHCFLCLCLVFRLPPITSKCSTPNHRLWCMKKSPTCFHSVWVNPVNKQLPSSMSGQSQDQNKPLGWSHLYAMGKFMVIREYPNILSSDMIVKPVLYMQTFCIILKVALAVSSWCLRTRSYWWISSVYCGASF